MSLENQKISCVRCKAYLFSEDDVVYCPKCGAPHHRECYNALGHCALEEFHGTEKEYCKLPDDEPQNISEEKKTQETENDTLCQMCGEHYNQELPKCPKCSAPNYAKINAFQGFDLLGGVPADYKLEEDVTAEDAKQFVMSNTHRYIPKFAILNKNHKTSWNWMAFLFPCQWMLSRKMFKGGIIAGALSIISSIFIYPFNKVLYSLGINGTPSYTQLVKDVIERLPQIGTAVLVLAFAGLLFDLGIRLFSALFGDYFYKNYSIASIKQIKANSDDIAADYRKKGGVNIFFFLIGLIALQYLPAIIAAFI